jgi:hypothetical protein
MSITRLQQARQMYALGQRVAKTLDGSRPGYRGEAAAASDAAGGRDAGRSDTGSASGRGDGKETNAPSIGMINEIRRQNLEKAPDVKEQPNLFSQIGTGLGNYIKGGGMIGMVGRGLGSLFSSLTGPKGPNPSEVGNLNMPGYNMLNIAGPVTNPTTLGGEGGEGNLNLYANQYPVIPPVVSEEEGITTLVNNPDFLQRFRVKNPYRQDKQGQLDPQILEMINNLYT